MSPFVRRQPEAALGPRRGNVDQKGGSDGAAAAALQLRLQPDRGVVVEVQEPASPDRGADEGELVQRCRRRSGSSHNSGRYWLVQPQWAVLNPFVNCAKSVELYPFGTSCTFRDLVPLVVDVTRVDECRSGRDDGGDQACQSTPDGVGRDIIAPGRDIVPVVLLPCFTPGSQICRQAGVALYRRDPRLRPKDRHQLDPRCRLESTVSALLHDRRSSRQAGGQHRRPVDPRGGQAFGGWSDAAHRGARRHADTAVWAPGSAHTKL